MASKSIILLILSVACFGSLTDASEKIHLKLSPKECYEMIRLATAGDSLDMVQLLADQGCSVNRPLGSKSMEPTPLHIAIANKNLQLVKKFVNDYGAEINAKATMAEELMDKRIAMCKYMLKDGSATDVTVLPPRVEL